METGTKLTAASPIFLRRVGLQNYKSIARCSLELQALNFLVGPNGAGKSNFLDALRFTADCLNTSVEHALRDRGGIAEVRRRSTGHPTHFAVRLDWTLPTGNFGFYSFLIGSKKDGGFEVAREKCLVNAPGQVFGEAGYEVRAGRLHDCTLAAPPAPAADRLFLVAASGQPEFRPLYDALSRLGLYHFNPGVIREWQAPDMGEVLAPDGRNLASVLKRLRETDPTRLDDIVARLGGIVPGIQGVTNRPMGKKETLEFRQAVPGRKEPWAFGAENMSDGTLLALGVLVALFQPPATAGRTVPLVGIEEPERSLHPGAAAMLRSALMLAAHERQVLVTTHSPDLLDAKEITADHILAVSQESGESLLTTVDEVTRENLRRRLNTAGELLRLNQITPAPEDAAPAAASDLFANP